MVDEAKQLINEIKQIRTQYVAEVGKGRRVWPRSIKDRVARLDEMGLPAKALAEQTGIPYETLILWRYKRRQRSKAEPFHEIAVAAKSIPVLASSGDILKSVTVTVPKTEMPENQFSPRSSLRLTTPQGFVIDGFNDDASVIRFLQSIALNAGSDDAL